MINPATGWFEIAKIPAKTGDVNIFEQEWLTWYPYPIVLIRDPGLVESRHPASAIQPYNVHAGQQSGYIPFEHCHLDRQPAWPTASLQPLLQALLVVV
jgi:hypothetical protein